MDFPGYCSLSPDCRVGTCHLPGCTPACPALHGVWRPPPAVFSCQRLHPSIWEWLLACHCRVVGVARCCGICTAQVSKLSPGVGRDRHHKLQEIKLAHAKDLRNSVGHLQDLVVMDVSIAYLILGWLRLPSCGENRTPPPPLR